jgi:tetratricopeptide (TPR) repeat protein
MAHRKRNSEELGYFLPKFVHYGLIGLLSVVLLSESVGARATLAQLQIAQQSAATPSVPLSAEKQKRYQDAVKLVQEGKELQKKETKEGYQQAIEKYQQALKIVQELGLRQKEVEILVYIGGAYNSISEEETALNYLQQALDKAQGLKPSYKAWILGLFTLIYSDMGRLDDAINSFKQTELIFLQQTKIEPDELGSLASSYKSIATVYNRKGEPEKAFYYLDKALKIYRDTLKSTDGEASVLEDIGFIHSLRGETSKAFEKYNQALAIFEKISNLPVQAQILSHIASLHRKMGKYQQAMKNLYIAQKLLEGVEGTLFQQGFIVSNIADVHAISGDYKAAIPYYQQAVNLYYKSGDTNLTLFAYVNISNMYKFSGEYQKALEYLNKGSNLSVKNKDGQALILQQNASIYSLQSDYQNALEEYNKALDIQRSIPRPTSEANTLKQIGLLYKSLGDYQSSINHYTKALDIYKKIGDKPQQAIAHGLIASVYDASKNYDEALKSYEQALLLLNKEDYQSEILTLRNMVRTYNSLKNYPRALETAQRALSLSKGKGKNEEFKTLNILAEVYDSNDNYQKALKTYQTILPYFRQAGLRFDEADILNQIGRTYTLSNQDQLAINTYNEELKLRRVFKNGTDEADVLYSIAKNQRKLENLETAITNIEEAIKIVENIRGNVKNQDLRTSYFATVQGYYKFYIDLLMELDEKNPDKNYDELALNVSERSRARGLLDLLEESNAKIRKGANPQLLEQERNLLQQINARETQRQNLENTPSQNDLLTKASIQRLTTETENLLSQYRELR